MGTSVENLRSWSHLLFWLSVILPLLGASAGVARFYVDRKEKIVSSAKTQAALQASKAEFEALKNETAPRRLSSAQEQAISDILKKHSPSAVIIVSRFMDDECEGFASSIGLLFEKCGWKVTYNRTSLNDFRGISALLIGVFEQPPEAVVAVDALEAAGIEIQQQPIKAGSYQNDNQTGLAIFVGKR